MPAFEYKAVDSTGQAVKGTLFGSSLDQALSELNSRGLKVDTIGVASFANDPLAAGGMGATATAPRTETSTNQETPSQPPFAGAGPESGPPMGERSYFETRVVGAAIDRVPLKDIMFFFRQFATMQKAGVPMIQTVDTLAGQARDGKLAGILRECKAHVEAGRPLSYGLGRYPETFTPLMLAMLRAGEEGGFLDSASAQVADYLHQEIELRNLYRRATFMPKLTVFGSIFIILVANAFINSLGGSLTIWSPLTQPVTWIYLGPLVVGIWLFFRVGLANPRIRFQWDQYILRVPYLGNTLRQLAMAKFGRAFGALYKGGVAIPKGILLGADACGNEYMRAMIYPAARRMESGESILGVLQSVGVFSPIVLDMIQTGETTGNLDGMLTKMSEYYEDEAAVRSEQTGKVFGVCAIVLVAIYVAIILIKFYSSYGQMVVSPDAGESMIFWF